VYFWTSEVSLRQPPDVREDASESHQEGNRRQEGTCLPLVGCSMPSLDPRPKALGFRPVNNAGPTHFCLISLVFS